MNDESVALSKLLRTADGPGGLIERARLFTAGLRVSDRIAAPAPVKGAKPDRAELERLVEDGHGQLPQIEAADRCAAMARAIDGVRAAGLPAVFAYVADPFWSLGERLRAELSTLVGRTYSLMADVWAWRIDPGDRGWPPHRGWASAVLDRAAPELINVWVGLSDVEADRACMHVVPLGEDASYPAHLEGTAARLESVMALPIECGTALFWNANTLHWGGACARRARGPRYSCSFSLVRDDAVDRIGWPIVDLDCLDVRARIDLVASQIVTYGDGKRDVSPEVLAWARATSVLRTLAARSGPELTPAP